MSFGAERDYVGERLDDQIEWHSAKARENKFWFMRFQVIIIISGSIVPLINVIDFLPFSTRLFSGFLGALVAIITSLMGLYKFQENWYYYRQMSTTLKKERYLYLYGVGEYSKKSKEQKEKILVEKIETLLSTEQAKERREKPGEETLA